MNEKEIYYVYLTTNNITKQQYVGDRTCCANPEEDPYLGSGTEIVKAFKIHKRNNFSKVILEKCKTRQQAGDKQGYYIKFYKTHVSQGGYNLSWDGGLCYGSRKHSEESKEKLRKPKSEITKQKIKEAQTGKIQSIETIDKRVKTLKNKPKIEKPKRHFSLEHRLNISNAMKNKRAKRMYKKRMPFIEQLKNKYGEIEGIKKFEEFKQKSINKKYSLNLCPTL